MNFPSLTTMRAGLKFSRCLVMYSKYFSLYLEIMELGLKMELYLVITFAKNVWNNVHD